jgi:hypothetical protein
MADRDRLRAQAADRLRVVVDDVVDAVAGDARGVTACVGNRARIIGPAGHDRVVAGLAKTSTRRPTSPRAATDRGRKQPVCVPAPSCLLKSLGWLRRSAPSVPQGSSRIKFRFATVRAREQGRAWQCVRGRRRARRTAPDLRAIASTITRASPLSSVGRAPPW